MAESIGGLNIELSASTAKFQEDMKKARDSVRSFTSDLSKHFGKFGKELESLGRSFAPIAVGITAAAGAATAAAAGLFAMAKSTANLGDQLNDASKITGITVEQLSFMKAVAEQSGATFDDVTTSLKFLNKNFSDLASGADKGKGPLQALGITAEQFEAAGNDVNKLLPEVTKRFGSMADGADKVKLAIELFGKSGTNLIPTLNDIAENGDALREKFESLGVILSTEVAEASDKFNDSLDDVNKAIEGVKIMIGSELLPIFTDLFKDLATWISKNRELLSDDVEGFVEGIKTAISNLKIAFDGLPEAISGTNTQFGLLTTTMIGVNELIVAAVKGISTLKTIQLGLKKAEELPGDILGLPSSQEFKDQEQALFELNQTIAAMERNLNIFKTTGRAATDATTQLYEASTFLDEIMGDVKETTSDYIPELKNLTGGTQKQTEAEKALKKAKEEQAQIDEKTLDQVQSLTKQWSEAADTFGMTAAQEREYTLRTIEANLASQGLSKEGLAQVKKALEEAAAAMSNLNFKEGVRNVMEFADAWGDTVVDKLTEGSEKAKEAIDSLGDFIGDVASNISDTIADMLTAAFTGNFDDITRSWKDMLKNMLNIFFQFVAAIITNPIRIALEATLKGGGGGFGDIFGAFGKAIGAIFGGGGGGSAAGAAAVGAGFALPGLDLAGGAGAAAFLPGLDLAGGASGAAITGGAGIGATISSAITIIGAVVAAAGLAISLILPMLKKTPHYAFKFESIKTDVGERAALVKEFLDPDLFSDEIFKTLSSHGGKGAFSGKEREQLKEAIQKAIEGTIESIQAIINKLPADMAAILNEAFLNTAVDMETKIGRSNLLGFDAKGAKEIKERLEKFFQGDLQARFIESVRGFFEDAFIALGALPEKAKEAIDKQFEEFKNAKSPEERAAIGEEVLAQFNAFVDAFNFTIGRFGDSAGEAIDQIKALATDLGFEGIPTFEEMSAALKEMLANAEIDPETVEKFKELRAAIVELSLALSSTALNLISFIDDLNVKIVSLGGSAMDTSAALQDTIDSLIALVNAGGLSASELQAALQQIGQALDMQYADLLEKAQAQAAKQQAAIQKQINAKQEQLRLITEKTNAEIEGLKEALSFAERFKDLAESIREDLRSLFTGPNSALTGIEKLNFIQGEVAAAAQKLAAASSQEDKLSAIEGLRDLQNELIDLGTSAFGTSSPEFQALFRETADQLQALVDQANKEGLKADSLQDKITALQDKLEAQTEKLNSSIKAAQDRLADLGAQEVKLSGEAAEKLRQTYEWLRDQAAKALQDVQDALKELGVDTSVLEPQLAVMAEQLGVQRETLEVNKETRDLIANLQGFAGGSGGFQDYGSGTLAVLHGREAVIRPEDVGRLGEGGFNLNINTVIEGTASKETLTYFANEQVRAFDDYLRHGRGREVIKEITG